MLKLLRRIFSCLCSERRCDTRRRRKESSDAESLDLKESSHTQTFEAKDSSHTRNFDSKESSHTQNFDSKESSHTQNFDSQDSTSTESFKESSRFKNLNNKNSLRAETSKSKSLVVASIDIGTTYSCSGFSFINHFETSPLSAYKVEHRMSGPGGKTLSCLLLNEHKELSAFGSDAEKQYKYLVERKEHKGWYFFRGFKRKLLDNMADNHDFMLTSENGNALPADIVYSAVIRHFKDQIEKSYASSSFSCFFDMEKDTKWVLTVPALWSDIAANFIRHCGSLADIPSKQLEIVLEPEAATLFAKYSILLDKSMRSNSDDPQTYFHKGFKFLICDVGGGSADISVCEGMDDGKIKELYVSSSEDWCCTLVFEKFCNMLGEKIGGGLVEYLKTCEDAFYDFYEEFNSKLNIFLRQRSEFLTIKFPSELSERMPGDTLQHFSSDGSHSSDEYFFLHFDKLKVRAKCINEVFENPIYKLCGYIRKAISHPHSNGVKLMIIVGGFSENYMLKEFLQKEFPTMKIYIPKEGSLAVMKGSLIYGHNPSVIAQRIANFTYGCVPSFEFEKDEGFITFGTDETPLCNGPFDKLVEIGTILLIGEPQVVKTYPKPAEAKSVSFYIYGSTRNNPKDVSDKSCFYLGNITMKYETYERDEGTVQLKMLFGGPIINITLEDLTLKRSEKVTINASLRLKTDDYLFVAAIDIGTTYSGYAFSSRDDYKGNPTEIITQTWHASTGNLQSLKTSTCVLFDAKKKFHSFGFAAEDKFMQLASENKHKEWFFFRRFKMKLYNKTTVDENLIIMSENGDSLPALTVFSAVIRYLKNKMMENMMIKNLNVHDYGLRWVITVPAIWTDSSKSFMRRCAIEAGIAKERLTIALEPEAAAIYTNFSSFGRNFTSCSIPCRKGIKYLVLDAGGGTVDITVHEMVDDEGHVKEVYKASGGDWGGTKVDEEVKKFYDKIVGKDVMEKFKKENMEGALELARDFETKKRAFKRKPEIQKVSLKFPQSLQDIYKDLNQRNAIDNDILKNGAIKKNDVQIRLDKILISADVFESFFTPSLLSICSHISNIFKHPEAKDVKFILLVGGYAESEILKSELEKKFPNQKLVIPKEPELSVLRGAVIFGHEPDLIQERKAKYTYGIECSRVFCEGEHREDFKRKMNGVIYCINIFDKHVEIGSTLIVGKYQTTRTYYKHSNDSAIVLGVYASSKENPKYVTDEGCFRLGSKIVEFEGGKTKGASVIEAQMSFSGTEIELTLTCKTTGRITKVHLENK